MLRVTLMLLTLLCCLAVSLASAPVDKASNDDGVVVALRPFVNWLSAAVQSNAARHELTITTHGQTVVLTLDSKTALVNGTPVSLAQPVVEQQGITFVPLPFLVSAFHATLSWNAKKTVATLTRADIKKPLVIPIAAPVPVVMVPKPVVEFIEAVEKGDLPSARKLVSAHPQLVNFPYENGMTPLSIAAEYGQAHIVKFLLDHKADIHATNKQQQTALHRAALGGSAECVKVLLAAGASPAARDFKDDLPLHFAAITSHVDVARLLLAQKIGLNAKDHDGDTPLRCAIKAKQKEMAAFLRGMGGHE